MVGYGISKSDIIRFVLRLWRIHVYLVVKCEQKEVLFYAGTRPHATPFTYNSVFIPLRSSHSACTVAHNYLCIRYNEDTRPYFLLVMLC